LNICEFDVEFSKMASVERSGDILGDQIRTIALGSVLTLRSHIVAQDVRRGDGKTSDATLELVDSQIREELRRVNRLARRRKITQSTE
jgi:hypothetical protein